MELTSFKYDENTLQSKDNQYIVDAQQLFSKQAAACLVIKNALQEHRCFQADAIDKLREKLIYWENYYEPGVKAAEVSVFN